MNTTPPFEFATATRILFGGGVRSKIASLAAAFGRRILVVTGQSPQRAEAVTDLLEQHGFKIDLFHTPGEPTVELVRRGVQTAKKFACDLVVGVGGGSAVDTGKAVAALTTNPADVYDYLEVVGRGQPLSQPPLPYIAVPTTAGTGAEVTRNAVLGSPSHGVKVSLRSPMMLPAAAVVDPELTHSMSPQTTAGTGLDALAQLIEAFVCNHSNPITDGLCREGIGRAAQALPLAWENGRDAGARADMALASLLSGLALANAKLGAVHGIAGPLGGMIEAPHGTLCGRLLPVVMRTNLSALNQRAAQSPLLARYDEVAQMLTADPEATALHAVQWLEALCDRFELVGLGQLGLEAAQIPKVVTAAQNASSMAGNPIRLTQAELQTVIEAAL